MDLGVRVELPHSQLRSNLQTKPNLPNRLIHRRNIHAWYLNRDTLWIRIVAQTSFHIRPLGGSRLVRTTPEISVFAFRFRIVGAASW